MNQFTNIEHACGEAGDTGCKYHVILYFSDGSYLCAPVAEVGPDWVSVTGLRDTNFVIDTADAEIDISYLQGPIVAFGPRLNHVATPRELTPIETAVNEESEGKFARDYATFYIAWPDGRSYSGPIKMAWPDRAEIEIGGERIVVNTADALINTIWDDAPVPGM